MYTRYDFMPRFLPVSELSSKLLEDNLVKIFHSSPSETGFFISKMFGMSKKQVIKNTLDVFKQCSSKQILLEKANEPYHF